MIRQPEYLEKVSVGVLKNKIMIYKISHYKYNSKNINNKKIWTYMVYIFKLASTYGKFKTNY